MKNDTITLPDGAVERPSFRRVSLSKWEASASVPFGTSCRIMAGYGVTRPEAAADLQKRIDEATR